MMKKTWIFLMLVSVLAACENQDKEFPDFEYNAVYFPVQFPVRSLSLGDDDIDNSLDKELKFHIGVAIGGMYENKQDWTVNYEVDESLCDSLGDDVMALPSSYYTLDPQNEVVIPAGSFSGLILVSLTEDFLSDSLASGNHYVIPLRITDTDADSILSGIPTVADPDKRVAANWDAGAPPKDFTLFMVKYVNGYHGNYLRRGVDYGQDAFGNIRDTAIYSAKYVEQDQLVTLSTQGRYVVRTNFTGVNLGDDQGVMLTFDPTTGDAVVETAAGAQYSVPLPGTGQFVAGGGSWGGRDRNVIFLEYTYRLGLYNHHVFDTLVFRDRGIAFEQFLPNVISN